MKMLWIILLFLLSCNNNHQSDTIHISRDAMQEWLDSTKSRIEFYRAIQKEQNDSTKKLWALVDSIQDSPNYSYKKDSPSRKLTDSTMHKIIEPIVDRKRDGYDLIKFYIGC